LAALRRRKWIVLFSAALLSTAAAYLTVRQTVEYRATAEVYITNQAQVPFGGVDTRGVYGNEPIETQANLARVPEVARIALRRASVSDRTRWQLLSQSQVTPRGTTGILEFSVVDRVPRLARRLATAYAEAFAEYRGRLDTRSLVRARREVAARLDELRLEGRQESDLYASLEETEQGLETFQALQTERANVIRRADSVVDTRPSPIRNAVIGLVLGLTLGLGLALLLETLDTRVRSAAEVSQRLGMPLLARIPTPRRKQQKPGHLIVTEDPSGPHAEAFRMLRTNLEFVTLEDHVRTILVTSALQGEGKSTTAANLAVASARSGRRVLLVDLDLRKPSVATFFGLEGRPGLTNVVLGDVTATDALVAVDLDGPKGTSSGDSNGHVSSWREDGLLLVLPSGPLPPDPGEFIGSRRLSDTLVQLRRKADLVLIDSPPLLRVGDAMRLSSFADGVILLTHLGFIRRGTLAEARRLLETTPARKLGFVVTGSQREDKLNYGAVYGAGYSDERQERFVKSRSAPH
jgi:Mrp family chromosome partitioning ATPase